LAGLASEGIDGGGSGRVVIATNKVGAEVLDEEIEG
jgi:hypothetical protein